MADLKIIKNLSGEIDNIPVINTAMSNAIYRGPQGLPGKDGDPGVYVGGDEPTINSLIWINPFIGNVLKIRNSVNDPWVEVPYIGPDMTIYATKEFVANEILKIDLSDYYTKEQVNNLIKNINIDLSDYYTKGQVDNLIPDTSGFALKSEIPDTTGLATETYVDDAIANIDIPEMDVESLSKIFVLNLGSTSSLITEEQKTIIENIYNNPNSLIYVDGMLVDHVEKGDTHLRLYYIRWDGSRTSKTFKFSGGKLTSTTVPSFSNQLLSANEVEVDRSFTPSGLKQSVNDEFKYVKNNYYTKVETDALIPDTSGLATEKYVDDAIANIDISESSGTVYVGADEPDDELVWFNPDENNSIDLSNYYTKSEVEAKINEALGVIENGTY